MNPRFWWYLTRATGLVAWAALAASLIVGVVVTSRLLGGRKWGRQLHSLHRSTSVVAVGMTAGHLGALVADSYVQFGPADLLVPFASSWRPGPVAMGVVAMWGMVLVVASSVARRRIARRAWKAVHVTSYASFWLATLHGITAGTDRAHPAVQGLLIAGVVAAAFVTTYRLAVKGQGTRTHRHGASRPTPVPLRQVLSGGGVTTDTATPQV